MPSNLVVRVRATSPALEEGLARIAGELDLPGDFPPEVTAAAQRAAAGPRLPELDRTDLPFLTIDPEGSMDLDQALHIERDGEGYLVHYAIADVAAFVRPDDPVAVEADRRVQTLYGAGTRIPLHPPELSEAAASLLPDQVRPVLLWSIGLDAVGNQTDVRVERALVRSRERWSYDDAQRALEEGTAGEVLRLLREVGEKRIALEAERGGVSLPLPEQEILLVEDDGLRLEFREQKPVELWNAQISLLTGMAAAGLMLEGRVGLLRTLPPPDPRDVEHLRRVARGLGIDWPAETPYPEFVRSLDTSRAAHQAMVVACTRLLRGSGYAAFDGTVPADPTHAAIAAPYAHVTAPLRRLGDRHVGEVCLALCRDEPVPGWARSALPELRDRLEDSNRTARSYERAVLDLVEAAVLEHRVGEEFDAVVTSVREDQPTRGVVLVREVGVEAPVVGAGSLPLGAEVRVRLETADVAARKVEFRLD